MQVIYPKLTDIPSHVACYSIFHISFGIIVCLLPSMVVSITPDARGIKISAHIFFSRPCQKYESDMCQKSFQGSPHWVRDTAPPVTRPRRVWI